METPKAKAAKKFTVWPIVVGALVGAVLSTWLAPKVIAWYFNPPAQMGMNCVEPIEWALAKLQIAQLVGILIGAVAGAFVYFWLLRKRSATPTALH